MEVRLTGAGRGGVWNKKQGRMNVLVRVYQTAECVPDLDLGSFIIF